MSLYIKYNPLKSETIIEFDGEALSSNSEYFVGDKRISQWISSLPKMTLVEWGTKKVHIEFEGSDYDYNLLQTVINKANENGYQLTCNHRGGQNQKQFNVDTLTEQLNEFNLILEERIQISNAIKEIRNNKIKVVVMGGAEGRASVLNALLKEKFVPADCDKNIIVNYIDKKDYSAVLELANGEKAKYDNFNSSIMTRISNNANLKTINIEGRVDFWESIMGELTISSIVMDNIAMVNDEIDKADVIVCVVDDFEHYNAKVDVKKLTEVNSNIVMIVADEDAWLDYAKDNVLEKITWWLNDNVRNLDKLLIDYIRENVMTKSLQNRIMNAKAILGNIRKEHENSLQVLSKRQSMISVNINEAKKPFEEERSLIYKIQNELKKLDYNYVENIFEDDAWLEQGKNIIRERIWDATDDALITCGTLQSKNFYLPSANEFGSIGLNKRSLSNYTESTEWFRVLYLTLLNDNVILDALINKKSTLHDLVQKKWEGYCDMFGRLAYEFCKTNYSSFLWGDPDEATDSISYYDWFKSCSEMVTSLVDILTEIHKSVKDSSDWQKKVILKNLGRVVYGENRIDSFRRSIEQKFLDKLLSLENARIRRKITLIQDALLVKSINYYISKLKNSKIEKLSFSTKLIDESNKMRTLNLRAMVAKYQKNGRIKTSFEFLKDKNEMPAIACRELYSLNSYLDIDGVGTIVDEVINIFDKYLKKRVKSVNVDIGKHIYKCRYTIQNELDSYLKALDVKDEFIAEQEKLLKEKDLEVSNEKVIINKLSELEKKLDAIVNF